MWMDAFAGVEILTNKRGSEVANEQKLVSRCKKRDFEAFGQVVDAYQTRVHGYVRRMVGDPEEALDLTQEVFIRAYQAFERFDGRSSLRTWLFRIAHNLCIDRARKLERGFVHVHVDELHEDAEPFELADRTWDPESVAMDAELMAVVEEGLLTMSEKLRSVILLHDREDLSYEEIARLVKVPVGTVKSRLFLARAHLQRCLSAYLASEKV